MSEEIKRISILDFVKTYNAVSSEQVKRTMLQNISKDQRVYIPYQKKIEAAEKIIHKANCINDNGNNKYVFNGPIQYLYYIKTLLDLYTNFQSNEPFYEEYDALNQNDLLSDILQQMPADKVEFDTIFNMVRDDSEQNQYYRILN